MSVFCNKCSHTMPNKTNIFGTFCTKCNNYIPPLTKPKIFTEAEFRIQQQHAIIRKYLRDKILGDNNGN